MSEDSFRSAYVDLKPSTTNAPHPKGGGNRIVGFVYNIDDWHHQMTPMAVLREIMRRMEA